MVLTKEAIQSAIDADLIAISDFKKEHLKAASYSLTLGKIEGGSLILEPGKFVCLESKERVALKGNYAGLLSTPKFLAIQGVSVTQGSDFIEPDTDNTIIFETSNNGSEPVVFKEGMRIAKLIVMQLQKN